MGFLPLGTPPARTPLEDGGTLTRPWERWFNDVRRLIKRVDAYSVTINPASVAANTSAEQTFTVTGLTTDMVVAVNKPTTTAGLVIGGARVSAADTLAITFGNLTGSPIDPASETYTVIAVRP